MRITVYIPCRNGGPTLFATLSALRAQRRPPDELLVVDDSDDDSPNIARSFGVEVLAGGGAGLAAARNVAWKRSLGDVLCGIDADVVVDPDYLEQVEQLFESRPHVAAICGRMDEFYSDSLADRWRGFHMKQHFGDRPDDSPRFLFGATLSVRRSALDAVGGWDRQFRHNYEDVDLSQRMISSGMNIAYWPACKASHLRKDDLDSVLRGFRQWHVPAGKVRGHFASVQAWNDERCDAVNWGIYRHRRVREMESARTDLACVTLMLPWAMCLGDLAELGSPACSQIGELAAKSLVDAGADTKTAKWCQQRLAGLAEGNAAERTRSDSDVALDMIRRCAEASLPRERDYWSFVASSIRAEEIKQGVSMRKSPKKPKRR